MMTQEEVNSLTKRWSIDASTILREYVQLLFLYYLYGMKGSDQILFKGGTAIRFLFGSFRFSEDLDFTTVASASSTRQLLEGAVQKLKQELATVEIGSFSLKRHNLTARLTYLPEGARLPLSIHLESSLREKPLTKVVSPIETLFPISPYPIVTHLSAEEIMAEKVRALMKRTKGRDLFDLWYLLSKEIPMSWKMVEAKMRFYREKATPEDLVSKIEKASQDAFAKDLAQFLPRPQRPIITGLKGKVLEKLNATLIISEGLDGKE